MCSVVSGSVAERTGLAGGARRGEACRPVLWATSAAVPLTAKRESGRTNFESLIGTAGGVSNWKVGGVSERKVEGASDPKVAGEAVRPPISDAIWWEGAGRTSPNTRAALSLVRWRELDLPVVLGGDVWNSCVGSDSEE